MSPERMRKSKSKRTRLPGSLTVLGTPPELQEEHSHGIRGFIGQFWRQFSRYLVTGLMVWVPLIVTLWVIWLVIYRVGSRIEYLIKLGLESLTELGSRVPFLHFVTYINYARGMGFLVILVVFLTTGLVTRYLIARKVIRFGEGVLERIPFISTVYRAAQQIRDVFVRRDGTVFQRVCLIEYPRKGSFVVAFVTSTEKGVVQEALDQALVAVFVPTTPNPTSGFLLYVPTDEVRPLEISVEDAMKLIVSAGAFAPEQKSGLGQPEE